MLQTAFTAELERHLIEIATRAGRASDDLARRALLAYLEDLEDYAIAVEAWKAHDPALTKSSDEVLRELGLED